MIDLHSHTFFSDGALVPAEHVRRVEVLGYQAIAITDHADSSNIHLLIPALIKAAQDLNPVNATQLIVGVELTHVPPALIAPLAKQSRALGAQLIVVHGETPVEPVAPGTNHAACSCTDVNVLAHPGLITPEDALLAKENGIALEITSRGGHNRTNGHVARIAREAGCQLVVDSDAHAPHDLLGKAEKEMVARGAGLSVSETEGIMSLNISAFLGS